MPERRLEELASLRPAACEIQRQIYARIARLRAHPADLPRRLADLRNPAEAEVRLTTRLLGRQAAPQVLFDLRLEMEGQLIGQLTVLTDTSKERAQALANFGNQPHDVLTS